jgi:uncharacterized membrane protein
MNIEKQRLLNVGLATLSFSIATLLRKISLSQLTTLQFQIIAGFSYAAVLPLIWQAYKVDESEKVFTYQGIIWGIITFFVQLIGSMAFMESMKGGKDTAIVASLTSSSPMITMMLAFIFLSEVPTLQQIIGSACIAVGAFILTKK